MVEGRRGFNDLLTIFIFFRPVSSRPHLTISKVTVLTFGRADVETELRPCLMRMMELAGHNILSLVYDSPPLLKIIRLKKPVQLHHHLTQECVCAYVCVYGCICVGMLGYARVSACLFFFFFLSQGMCAHACLSVCVCVCGDVCDVGDV